MEERMKKKRVLLADDHKIVVEGLKSLLAEEYELVGTAADGHEMLAMVEKWQPDVVVADISMPLLNGVDALRKLRAANNPVKVVFLTMHPDAVYVSRALEAGASGYVLKHSAPDELVTAIEAAMRGERFVSPALRSEALEAALVTNGRLDLTGRQREVLQLLAEGKSAKEIGALLGISPRTVETHKYKMMDELGVKTSAQLVQVAIRQGLVAGGGDP